nr:hypothetical protein [Acidobacteriota bacterium]
VVHRHGGRVAWQGVGVDGNGLLGQRIDRLLSGQILREVSRMKKLLIAAACIGAVFVAVACRTEPPPLKPDPALAERLAANRAFKSYEETRAEAQAQLVQLRAALEANPNDMDALKKVLTAYGLDFSGKPNPHAAEYTEARRPYILRVIKEHPESELAGSWLVRMYPSPREPLQDPIGYAEGRALWSAHIRRPSASAAVLVNAASWLESYDKPLAQEALLRLAKLDAKSASSRLGRLYALTLVGSNASMPLNVVRSNDAGEATSAFAASVRKTLAETKDVVLLSSTCQTLFRNTSSATGLAFDPVKTAVEYCDRTLALDPANEAAISVRQSAAERTEILRQRDVLKGVDRTQRFAAISKLPESEQLPVLGRLAASSWFAAVDFEYNKHDQAAADPQWKQARQFAEAAIVLGAKLSDRPEAAEQVYQAKIVLAALALHDGSRQGAVRWLSEAAAVSRATVEAPMNSVEDAVVHHLLKAGEREAIISFYDKAATIPGPAQSYALKAALALRAGVMPLRYQYFMTQESRPSRPLR